MKGKSTLKIFYSLVLFFLFNSPLILLSQDLKQHNWYFGSSTQAIRFNRGTNAAQFINNQSLPFNKGGAAVATDPATANLLFYTDGVRVYDASHVAMPNGSGLTGQTDANQPVAISPVPGQANKYYVFTNSANYTTGGSISRSIVDMSLFGNAVFPAPASGDIEVATKSVPMAGLTNRSEGMIVVPDPNRTDFWLITHQNASQSYSATKIDATATFPTTTTSGIGLPMSVANFSYHPASKKLAVSPQDPNTHALIIKFNNTSGVFSHDRTIFNSATASTSNQSIYDIEWDTKGQHLYLSRNGETGIPANVFQYDYINPSISLTSVLGAPVFRSYGLQIAPDSAIYHLYQAASGGPFLVGKLTNTDTVASEVINTQSLFAGANFNGTQFPSFTPKDSVVISISFTSSGSCQNSPTAFFPTVLPNADSLRWDFGDGNNSSGWSPIHTYPNAGSFNAKLIAFYRGQKDSTTLPIIINQFALRLQLVQDTTACRGEFPPPRGSSSPKQFSVKVAIQGGVPASTVWSNGDLGDTLTPDSAGYYYVVVTDVSGCSAYAGVNVKEYELQDSRSNVWYFGNKAGIDFNPIFDISAGPAKALNQSIMDAPEGCATISDRNGELIFYTDGDKVFDKTHTQIDSGIGGDPTSAQSALIVAVPGDETLYYIFTTQAVSGTSLYELRYSLFDLKLNSGKGALIQKNILLFAKSTEHLTSTPQWLIAHEYGNNTFRTYPITTLGIGEPVYSEIGSIHSFKIPEQGQGYMKIGPNGNLAVALSTPGTSNLIELFQFDNNTGRLSNYRKIDLNEPAGQVYGVEFSPGGNKVFATVKGSPSPSVLFEYFLDSLSQPFFKQRIQQNGEFGALQLGPDGQIYMAINGSNTLGTIQAVDDTTRLSAFNLNGFNLAAGTNSRLGLPNFIQIQGNGFGGPGFTFSGICVGDTTRFNGTPTDAIDKFQWFFGDGGSSTEASPVHLYAAAGTYTVSMRLFNRCSLDTTIIQKVTIFSPPPKPTVPGAIALCTGAVTLDANNTNIPGLTYVWSSGDSTKTVTFNQASFVTVTNTDTNGCFSSAQTIVAENRPQVDLGLDLTICEDNATPTLNAQNPGATYQWKINGINAGTVQTQAVDTSTPGVFTYEVTITDPVTTCFITDQKAYTVNVSPSFTLTGINPTACGTTTGTITLQLNNSIPASGPYSYSISGPGGFNQQGIDQLAPSTTTPFVGRVGGTYSAIVQDQISGCTISRSVGLTDNVVITSVTPTVINVCAATYSVAVAGGTGPYRFTFTNSGTGQVIGPSAAVASPFTSPALSAGTYILEVRDAGNCVFISPTPLTVTPNPPNTISISQTDLCDATPTLTASGTGLTYNWTSSVSGGIDGSATGATIQLISGLGSVTYTVTSSGGSGCSASQSVTVNVLGAITPSITQSDACAEQVTLTASPSGNFTYRWFKAGVFQPSLLGRQIVLGTSENGLSYQVQVVSTQTGCTALSTPQVVSIISKITATVTSTPACDNNKTFTLTATTNSTSPAFAWFFNGSALSTATAATTDQLEAGTYRIDVRQNTCLAQAEIQIIKAPIPVGSLPDRVIICNDPDNVDPSTSSIDLDPGDFTTYNWFKNQVALNYTLRVLNADSKGLFEVDITNSFGCVVRDKTEVNNECLPKIEGPNAFRPTSSLAPNKEFSLFTYFITDNFHIFIYNRWGELVFESTDRNFKWNGGYRNNASQPVPVGMYAYIVKYESAFRPDKGIQDKRGGVSLIR